jgi:hypothetical protein
MIQPLSCGDNRGTRTEYSLLEAGSVPHRAEVYRANQYDFREVPADAVFPVGLKYARAQLA